MSQTVHIFLENKTKGWLLCQSLDPLLKSKPPLQPHPEVDPTVKWATVWGQRSWCCCCRLPQQSTLGVVTHRVRGLCTKSFFFLASQQYVENRAVGPYKLHCKLGHILKCLTREREREREQGRKCLQQHPDVVVFVGFYTYILLFSTLEQTHCAPVACRVILNEWLSLFTARFWVSTEAVHLQRCLGAGDGYFQVSREDDAISVHLNTGHSGLRHRDRFQRIPQGGPPAGHTTYDGASPITVHHLWLCITYDMVPCLLQYITYDSASPVMVHCLLQYITCDCASPMMVHYLLQYITYDCASPMMVHYLWQYITYDSTSLMIVHYTYEWYITYDNTSSIRVHHLWQCIIYKGTSPMTIHHL